MGLVFPLQLSAQQDTLEISANLVFVAADTDTAELAINVTADSVWSANTDASWIVLLPATGKGDTSILVIVEPNPLSTNLIDTVFFTSQGLTVSSAIVQSPFICEVPTNLSLVDSVVFQHSL